MHLGYWRYLRSYSLLRCCLVGCQELGLVKKNQDILDIHFDRDCIESGVAPRTRSVLCSRQLGGRTCVTSSSASMAARPPPLLLLLCLVCISRADSLTSCTTQDTHTYHNIQPLSADTSECSTVVGLMFLKLTIKNVNSIPTQSYIFLNYQIKTLPPPCK